nr:DUF21 domain-containing protein [Porphyromonas cangingivalis]
MDIDGYLQQLFADITVTPLTWATGLALIVVVILLMLSAYMSGSEVAFFSLSPADLDEIRNSKDKRDTIIQELLADSERLLGTILVGNNMVNVAIVMLSNYIVSDTLDFSSAPILASSCRSSCSPSCSSFLAKYSQKSTVRTSRCSSHVLRPLP